MQSPDQSINDLSAKTSMQRDWHETEILERIQPGLVHKNIDMWTKNWKYGILDPKQEIGSSILNKGKVSTASLHYII